MPILPFAYRSFQQHLFPVAIALVTIFIALAGPEVQQELRYDRSSVFAGEPWRLITAHFVHLSWGHLLMNLAAMGLVWGLAWHTLRLSTWLGISMTSMLSVSLGLFMFNPELEWYVGLSGILHGFFLAGIVANLAATSIYELWTAREDHRLEIVLLLALCGKVAWEQIYGPLPGSAEFAGGAVIVDAHFYGLVGGLVGVLPYILLKRNHKPAK